jgi:hypothetical protein
VRHSIVAGRQSATDFFDNIGPAAKFLAPAKTGLVIGVTPIRSASAEFFGF